MPITPAQLGYMLEGIDWRAPQHTWRPECGLRSGASCGARDPIGDYRHDAERDWREAAILAGMALDPARLPDDIATLKALLVGGHAARVGSDSRAEAAEAPALDLDADLKLTIAKMQRETTRHRSPISSNLSEEVHPAVEYHS